ncbi:flagellar export chaperone FliS [Desulfovibrio subterraneus]|jgi:flagellar protein FliS|uniref:Flagellar protein FliS n=1 Tax=Desulfovibrio subterraneus TaxID=2718620 RepID=A0A7J0BF71_9BACT|nr:flagellar export chaperone FliS [Desulfovibrio subterraneus]WBF68626.1 flagellar export chaperone FliS [Desulfovibrio subterraneus]GFM31805.1 flagellar protein FliS [Desulfovibrio subterraneus]
MQKAAKAYFQTQVATTSQGKLLLMLYDGCIKFLNQSKVKIEERDYAQKGILISKALDVINELDSSLNAEKGGELAENLHKLYFYCSTRLLNANLKMDIGYIDEVIKILSGLRSAYAQIIDTPEAAAAAAMTTPVQTGQTNVTHNPMGGIPKPAAFGGAKGPMPKANAFAMQAQAATAPAQESGIRPGAPTGGYAKPAQSQQATPPAQGQPVQTTAPAEPDVTAPQQAQPDSTDSKPLDFSGKRLSGAAMYRKIAAHNNP